MTLSAGTGGPALTSSSPDRTASGRTPVRRAMSRSASNRVMASLAAGPKVHRGAGSGVTTVSSASTAPRSRRSTAAIMASS